MSFENDIKRLNWAAQLLEWADSQLGILGPYQTITGKQGDDMDLWREEYAMLKDGHTKDGLTILHLEKYKEQLRLERAELEAGFKKQENPCE